MFQGQPVAQTHASFSHPLSEEMGLDWTAMSLFPEEVSPQNRVTPQDE